MGSKPGRKTIRDYIHQAQYVVRHGEARGGFEYVLYPAQALLEHHAGSADLPRMLRDDYAWHQWDGAFDYSYRCKGSRTLYLALRHDFMEIADGVWKRKERKDD